MIFLRQSTASQEVPLGPFYDYLDGDTAETGLTIANTDIKIWKAGATTAASKNSGGATHISDGIYYAVLDATDTDTLGSGTIYCKVTGATGVHLQFTVLSAAVYDSGYFPPAVQPTGTTHDNPVPQTTGGWRSSRGAHIWRTDWEEIDDLRARLKRAEKEAERAEKKAFKARTKEAINRAAAEMAAAAEAKEALRVEIARKIEAAEQQDEEDALIALLGGVM